MLVGGDGHSDYTQVYGGSPFLWHGLDRPLWRSRRKLKTRHKTEQKPLSGPTCGPTCPGPRVGPRLQRCSVLSSSSRLAWPPSTDHSGGVLLSPTLGLGSTASANLKPPPSAHKTSLPEDPNPAVKKLLTLLTPLWGPQDPLARAKIPPCWGRTASILPRMEPGLQAEHAVVLSAILRPRCFHKASSPSETHM